MITMVRKYHFYAAHRNVEAGEKCGRIHGHTYDVGVHFNFPTFDGNITILFEDVDKMVEPIIKGLDHYFLLWDEDPLFLPLVELGEPFYSLPFPTSAENVAMFLYHKIKSGTNLPISKLELGETKSSIITYEE